MKKLWKQSLNRVTWVVLAVALVVVGSLLYGNGFMQEVCATQESENGAQDANAGNGSAIQMLYINADTNLYQRASENAKVLTELTEGSLVIFIEGSDTWSKVCLGEFTGYVKTELLQKESPNEELHEEMENLEVYDAEFVNEVERLMAEKRRSRIFGAIIVVLIVAIFGVGIFSTLRKKKQAEGEKEESDAKDAEEALEYLDDSEK